MQTLTTTRPAQAAPPAPGRVRGVRMGFLRPRRRREPDRGPWMGDLNVGIWYAEPSLPRWINQPAVSVRLVYSLALAQVSMVVLGLAALLMVA